MAFKNTYTAPDATPDKTYDMLSNAVVSFRPNVTIADVQVSFDTFDALDAQMGTRSGSFQLSSAGLTTLGMLLVDEARLAGVIPAGTTAEE